MLYDKLSIRTNLVLTPTQGFDVQTTQLNVAQLMGEFLGKENGRITRKIMSSEFSEELRAQHANFFGGSAAPVAIDSTRLGTDDDGSLAGGVEGAPRAGQLSQPASTSSATTQQQQPSAPAQKITHSSAAKRSLRDHLELLVGKNPSAVSEEETQEQLVF
ncbi:MAG: hypothetical protein RBS57_14270, partial [Desulforhabdus sp.]|nr:hypothetical protein [Desulforhabdus sp.]